MHINKKLLAGVVSVAILAGAVGGFLIHRPQDRVFAQEESDVVVDDGLLDDLYDSVFHRPVDAEGRAFHRGRLLKQVLRDFRNSPEMRYYTALFKAVKAYEEAVRAPGDLTEEQKQRYLNLINSALGTLLAWVETLPDQSTDRVTVTPLRAREAIHDAYLKLNNTARVRAEYGLFNASARLGAPNLLATPALENSDVSNTGQ